MSADREFKVKFSGDASSLTAAAREAEAAIEDVAKAAARPLKEESGQSSSFAPPKSAPAEAVRSLRAEMAAYLDGLARPRAEESGQSSGVAAPRVARSPKAAGESGAGHSERDGGRDSENGEEETFATKEHNRTQRGNLKADGEAPSGDAGAGSVGDSMGGLAELAGREEEFFRLFNQFLGGQGQLWSANNAVLAGAIEDLRTVGRELEGLRRALQQQQGQLAANRGLNSGA